MFPHRPASWPLLLALHVIAALFALGVGPARTICAWLERRFPKTATVIADWYALSLIPLLYTELATLNAAVWNGRYFDPTILRWEEALFGGQPSLELARKLPYLALSEPLHFAYISYYFIVFLPPLILYVTKRTAEQRRVVFAIMVAFFVHYVFFIYYPVQGPRYLFAAPSGEVARGPMYYLAHRILESGSSRGAAFPSSHVGVSVAATAATFLAMRRFAAVLAVLTFGLAFGAVYAGFHYATDAVAGLLLGLVCFAAAPRLRRWLGGLTA